MIRILTLLAVCLGFLWLFSCGNQVPLTGGPKDEIPPVLDTVESTHNYQTQFKKEDITLVFDEFINLRDAAKQILISPPLENPPIIGSRLKKVSVKFSEDEVLKENATYVINFGSAIQDYTEGNKLENYTFVFSTGDYIDSLSIKGTVKDAFDEKPVEGMIVMLYIDHRDSIPYLDRPFYFAQTDKEGDFSINNLRAESFKVVVLEDLNLSYTYNPESERIGFLDSLYILNDSSTQQLELQLFKEGGNGRYAGHEALNQGKLQIDWDNQADTSAITILDSITYYYQPNPDQNLTSILWYKPRRRSRLSWEHIVREVLDTTSARINMNNTDTLPGAVSIVSEDHDKQLGLHPEDTLWINFDLPIKAVDPLYIQAIVRSSSKDTLPGDTIALNWIKKDGVQMKVGSFYNWTPDKYLEIELFPGAITDFWDRSNDTMTYNLTIATAQDFGEIQLQFQDFDSSSYFVQVMDKEKVVERISFHGPSSEIVFSRFKPATYSLQIVADTNQNQKWDPGNYLEHQQSEAIYRTQLEALRPDWTLEQSISLLELINQKVTPPSEEGATPSTRAR